MRLVVIFLSLLGFFLSLPTTTTAQSNGTIPPATALVITGEPVGTAETREVAYADLDQDGVVVMRIARNDTNWTKVATVVIVRYNNGAGNFTQGVLTYIDPVAPTSIDSSRIAFLALLERLYLPFVPNGE